MIKVLIVDNDISARDSIKHLLKSQADIEEVIEASHDDNIINLCVEISPDIIFIDIQTSHQTTLSSADDIPSGPALIFATTSDQHAIHAFDLNAVDYLLKPFSDNRFYAALSRARMRLNHQTSTSILKAANSIKDLTPKKVNNYKSRLIVRDPGCIRLIDVDNINYISGAGNYADVFLLDGGNILHRETLAALVQQLDPDIFIRIHRSSIIRKDSVYELRTNDNGDYTVVLKTGEHLTLSRRNRSKLEVLLQE
jgi:two-component system LytT family response regulator